jgi:hypothetical protein
LIDKSQKLTQKKERIQKGVEIPNLKKFLITHGGLKEIPNTHTTIINSSP